MNSDRTWQIARGFLSSKPHFFLAFFSLLDFRHKLCYNAQVMGERLVVNPMPEKQAGDSFRPFKELASFPQLTIDKEDYTQILFAYEFIFDGVLCAISVNAFFPDTLSHKDTPLGKVRIVKSGDNGKETLEELPITFYLNAVVPSFEKYEELGKYALEFELGDNKYYLSFGGEDPNIRKENFEEDEKVGDYGMKNKNGQDRYVALPFNPDLIRDLDVSLVQKDMGLRRRLR